MKHRNTFNLLVVILLVLILLMNCAAVATSTIILGIITLLLGRFDQWLEIVYTAIFGVTTIIFGLIITIGYIRATSKD